MDVKLVIDAIVQQTTVLIAQLATSAGMRAPLSDLANQTFLSLVTELERQGIGQKVIADMFGLALRSYQQKVQRLSESATDRGRSLWEAVHSYVQEQQVVSRSDVLQRFQRDDVASVRSILNDLIDSGLVFKTGRGDATVLRAASIDEVSRAGASSSEASREALCWLMVYRHGPLTLRELATHVRLTDDVLERVLDAMTKSGRVRRDETSRTIRFTSDSCLIAHGERAGWEAALLDHYHALVRAMCAKLEQGRNQSQADDRIGGSTYSFDVWPGHPHAERVYALLASHRSEMSALWNEATAYGESSQKPVSRDRVTFYFGQSVTSEQHAQESRDAD